jgi:hypothetical protein
VPKFMREQLNQKRDAKCHCKLLSTMQIKEAEFSAKSEERMGASVFESLRRNDKI